MELNLKSDWKLRKAIEDILGNVYDLGMQKESLSLTDEAEKILNIVEQNLDRGVKLELK